MARFSAAISLKIVTWIKYYERVIDYLTFFRFHYIRTCRNINTVFHVTKNDSI
jgi:hypothetical protein